MLLRIALGLFATTSAVVSAASGVRVLEDAADVEGYQYLDDLSSSYTKYSTCFRVKIQEDNDDDDQEGNSYFYNGKYYAQYTTYAAFHLCSSNSCDKDTCDESTGYVTDLQDYLESNVEFVQNYCTACDECERRLEEDDENDEEEEEENEIVVDCDTCADQCALLGSSDSGNDEADYLDCQATYNDGEIQYYQAPTCSNDGNIVMGYFYDDECTVKSNAQLEMEFSYETFGTVEGMCAACDGNDDVCSDLYQDAAHCFGTTAMQGGDYSVCKKYYAAAREVVYSPRSRKWHVRNLLLTTTFLSIAFSTFAYTYFVRHQENTTNEKTTPLSTVDHGTNIPQIS